MSALLEMLFLLLGRSLTVLCLRRALYTSPAVVSVPIPVTVGPNCAYAASLHIGNQSNSVWSCCWRSILADVIYYLLNSSLLSSAVCLSISRLILTPPPHIKLYTVTYILFTYHLFLLALRIAIAPGTDLGNSQPLGIRYLTPCSIDCLVPLLWRFWATSPFCPPPPPDDFPDAALDDAYHRP